jgi:hypothetical protein
LEDAVLRKDPPIDEIVELHLLASQISSELLQVRRNRIVICDKSVLNVIAYWRVLLAPTQQKSSLFAPALDLASAYARHYDGIFHLSDMHDPAQTPDPFRPADGSFQRAADEALRALYAELGLQVTYVPPNLDLEAQVRWVSEVIVQT